MSKNIFGGQSARALSAHYVYEELRKREFVTLVDVLCIYYKRDKSYYDLHTYSSDKAYIQLKKAFPEVVRALEQVESGCVIDNGKTGKGKALNILARTTTHWLRRRRQWYRNPSRTMRSSAELPPASCQRVGSLRSSRTPSCCLTPKGNRKVVMRSFVPRWSRT